MAVTQNRIVDYQLRPLALEEREWLEPLVRASRARGTTLAVDGTIVRVPLGPE